MIVQLYNKYTRQLIPGIIQAPTVVAPRRCSTYNCCTATASPYTKAYRLTPGSFVFFNLAVSSHKRLLTREHFRPTFARRNLLGGTAELYPYSQNTNRYCCCCTVVQIVMIQPTCSGTVQLQPCLKTRCTTVPQSLCDASKNSTLCIVGWTPDRGWRHQPCAQTPRYSQSLLWCTCSEVLTRMGPRHEHTCLGAIGS